MLVATEFIPLKMIIHNRSSVGTTYIVGPKILKTIIKL